MLFAALNGDKRPLFAGFDKSQTPAVIVGGMAQEDGQVFQRHFLRNGLPPIAIAYRYGINGKQFEARERAGDVERTAANLPSAVAGGDIATALRQRIEMENNVAKSGADNHDRPLRR